MEKIKVFKNDQNLTYNIQNYYIMPYHDEKDTVYININNDSIKWYDSTLKQKSQLKRINKSLMYFYKNSKFNNFNIVIIGYLISVPKFNSLCIFDLLLNDQFQKKIQSKKYSIRYENICKRFLTNIPKSIKNVFAIFSKKYQKNIFDNVCNQCISSNKWEGYSLYKDRPYNYYDDQMSMITNKMWEIKVEKIKDIKFIFDLEKKQPVCDGFIVNIDNNDIIIKNQSKMKNLDEINNCKLIGKQIKFKICNLNSKIYTKFLNFE